MTHPDLAGQAWLTGPPARAVVSALARHGGRARFVGGCVRDALLGREVGDLDLATDARPEDVLRWLGEAGIKVVPTGLKHGTVTAVVDHTGLEITTLRRDVETHGRHATVAFTDDWQADAERRDFTMNAIYADPDGTLFDPVGGLADLRAGWVRFVGDPDRRIEEDRLRLLRFFRFQAWYGRTAPDPSAVAACARARGGLDRLSGERVQAELLRLLEAPAPAPVLALMREHGILRAILGVDGDLSALERLLRAETQADGLRRLAALLSGEPAAAEAAAERLRLSRRNAERLAALAALPPPWLDGDDGGLRAALYREGDLAVDRALLAGRADVAKRLQALPPPRFPLRGGDVLALGVPEGPAVSALLGEVEAWWLAQGCGPDRCACYKRLRSRMAGDRDQGSEMEDGSGT